MIFGIFATLAEFERDLIRERTMAGLAAARARGRKGGRKFALTKAQVRLAQAAMANRDTSVAALAAELDELGPGALYARLRDRDPQTAERVDPRNGRRIVRALEVLEQGEQTHGAALPEAPVLWHEPTRIVGAQVPREQLVLRLDERVDDGAVARGAAPRGLPPVHVAHDLSASAGAGDAAGAAF